MSRIIRNMKGNFLFIPSFVVFIVFDFFSRFDDGFGKSVGPFALKSVEVYLLHGVASLKGFFQ